MARYVALFNQRDWDGLRALLADDVKLHQSLHPLRVGRADVGLFFTLYAKIDAVSLAPAWLEGREVIAVFEDRADPKPSYVMWLEWRDGRISFIHDYRYVRYITADAELTLAPGKSRGRRRGSVTCGAEYAAGAEFRLASRQCHVHLAHVRSPNAGALHWYPFCFDPAQHLVPGKGNPQFDLGERLESDGRNFRLRVGRSPAQRLGHPLPLDAFLPTVQ